MFQAGVAPVWQAALVQKPKKLTVEQLAAHLRQLETSSREDVDALLTDLLCHVYKSRDTQDS
jgi:hypothetical protein